MFILKILTTIIFWPIVVVACLLIVVWIYSKALAIFVRKSIIRT